MSKGARRGGDFIIQKYNLPIQKFSPIVLLKGIILGIFKRQLFILPVLCQHEPDMMDLYSKRAACIKGLFCPTPTLYQTKK